MPNNPDRDDRDDQDRNYRSRYSKELEYITRHQAEELVTKTCQEEIKNIFRQFGIDAANYADLNKLRDDLYYLRQSREANSERKSNFSKSAVTAVVGAIVGTIGSVLLWFLSHFKS